ncbi:DUF6193 family natural product biosynthesis protein [Paractinoplanes atraurantiacus]|uniref:Uncharacterized protein n=1 Tax=Paractinoplanes atraurantiacus TaxID=1036182 RepID=A0A285K8W5_9ACTN|nr:hypothetical protein SAMN05421748_133113 [Actinoplanes atraurantiacus]
MWLSGERPGPIGARLAPFLALAFREPRLRELRPYTSHWTLLFSRTAEWPFTRTGPAVAPTSTPGRFVVDSRKGHPSPEIGAATALHLVLTHLPASRPR